MDKVPKKKVVLVNFSCALISVLDFQSLEDGTDRLSRNLSKELLLYTAQYVRRAQISHDSLAMQTLVWLHIVQFRAIQFGAVWFSASYANLWWPHVFKHQIWGYILALLLSKYSI